MRNADRIRAMSDDELQSFIWWWQVNVCTKFFTGGPGALLDAAQIYDWLLSEEFKCDMTKTPEDEE